MASRKNLFSKMILTHESGSEEDQFDEKNGGRKSRDTIPLSSKSAVELLHSLQRFESRTELWGI